MNIQKAHPKLMESSLYMMKHHPFYCEILLGCNFINLGNKIPTIGVNVSYNGFNMAYNPEYLDSKPAKEMNFIIVHELHHLLNNHMNRTETAHHEHKLANIVQDMIINTSIIETHGDEFKFPEGGCLIPEEYDGVHIYEILYDWVQQKKEEQQQKQKQKQEKQDSDQSEEGQSGSGGSDNDEEQEQDSDGSGNDSDNDEEQEQDSQEKGNSTKDIPRTGDNGSRWGNGWEKIFDNNNEEGDQSYPGQFDEHMEDEVPDEVREAMIKDVINAAKARGLVHGGVEKMLEKLRKSRKNYLKLIKSELSMLMGKNKQKTWQRFSRRGSQAMAKGYKKYQKEINVVLDTSGSMSNDFERALSYVFYHGITMNLIQCDTEVNKVSQIKSVRELQKEKIVGLGGTTISPALQHIADDSKMSRLPTLILTDGYTDRLETSRLKKQCLILSTETECPVDSGVRVRQIVIDKEYR